MRQTLLLVGALLSLCPAGPATHAQQVNEPSKIEVSIHFASITGQDIQPQFGIDRVRSEVGPGGRFTFNFNKHVALEAEGNFFPRIFPDGFDNESVLAQGQFGVKAGKRFDRFGIFAKARPGFISSPEILIQTGTQTIVVNDRPVVFPIIDVSRRNFFSMDIGGVLEFYPSRGLLVRFDAGDTVVHVGDARTVTFAPTPPSPPLPRVSHNFQFNAGIAFRFFNSDPATQDPGTPSSDEERKFELGVQFSSIRLVVWAETQLPSLPFEVYEPQSGFGGRLTYNFTPSISAEIQTDFYPKELFDFANGRAGGHMLQLQAGPKIGKRFQRFGVFGKVRPGAVNFSDTITWNFVPFPTNRTFRRERRTHFSLDLGGVLEFYPSPRIVTRFDAGDTMIHYGETQVPFFSFSMPIIHMPSRTRHQFQFSAGVGFRF